jgi:hypothetical protein
MITVLVGDGSDEGDDGVDYMIPRVEEIGQVMGMGVDL